MTEQLVRLTVYTRTNQLYTDDGENSPHVNGHEAIVKQFERGDPRLAGQERCYEFKYENDKWEFCMEFATRALVLGAMMQPTTTAINTAMVLVTYWSDRATISILERARETTP